MRLWQYLKNRIEYTDNQNKIEICVAAINNIEIRSGSDDFETENTKDSQDKNILIGNFR